MFRREEPQRCAAGGVWAGGRCGWGIRRTVPNRSATGTSSSGRASTQPPIIATIDTAKITNPTQSSTYRAAYMWLRLRSALVVSTSTTCTKVNSRKNSMTG